MNAPARKLSLHDLLPKWWDAKKIIKRIELDIEAMQNQLHDNYASLNVIENDIGRASECFERSMVYSIGEATVLLAWQEERNYHTIELVNLETL
jgi:hypothetical protein